MDRYKIEKRHRKKVPRVPIKTYKWEDIRRARLKGGYPWTYLYKEPFNENIDTKLFIMDSKLKKSKASTKLVESSDRLEIKEISNGGETPQGSLTPEPSGYIVITEVPSDSESHSKDVPGGSVTIEDIGDGETLNLESAESSDNISQYLDKEEPIQEPAEISKKIEEAKTENGRSERAKSEEPKRKRKLSIDSSYSRKSLSKLAIMKKLKDAKNKIKVPKLNLPSLPNVLVLSNPLKSDKHEKNSKKEEKNKQEKPKNIQPHFQPDPNAKPKYIHIPLKPPEGQTDEFSYLEFGDKKPEEQVAKEKSDEKQLETPTIKISEAYDDGRRFSGDSDDIVAFEILKTETIDLDHANKNGFQGGSDYLIIEQEDDAKSESRSMIIIMSDPEEQENKPLSRAGSQRLSRQGSTKTLSRAGSQKQITSKEESKKVRAKSAEPEKKRKLSADSGYSRISTSKIAFLKKLKNAKDKIKMPKFSLSKQDAKKKNEKDTTEPQEVEAEIKKKESKKDEPKYIHIPLKPPPGQSDEFSYLEFEEKKEKAELEKIQTKEIEPKQQDSIDSPASSKDGVQFIFLTPPSDDEILDHPEIPETPSSEKSQLFFSNRINELKEIAKDALDSTTKKLQPVVEEEATDTTSIKDEKIQEPEKNNEKIKEDENNISQEIKDKEKNEEETKNEENKEEKSESIDKEKTEKTKGKGKKKKGKQEEKKNDKSQKTKLEDSTEKQPEKQEPEKVEKMVVDEEDGLKLTESAMAKQEQNVKAKEVIEVSQELKSSIKADGSPVFKKKVSFKRRSKDSKDDDYEDIQVPTDDKFNSKNATDEQKSKLGVMGTSQSMSVDEEKSYLDEQKIIKSTSLEEDYNRWSKLSDHEYEPVNPPPENISPISAALPTVHVIDTDRGLQTKPISVASSTTSLERRMLGAEIEPSQEEPHETTEQMQSEIEKKLLAKFAETPSQPQTTVHTITTITTQSDKSEPKKPVGPNKFQQAIKTQTDKFKIKLHEMKKPNIKLPSKPTIKKPNLQKFKFERPKINLPKIPDTAKITLPTFSLPRKSTKKRSLKQRHLSTESNAGGSKKNYFDFRTYPRLFKKKPKHDIDSFSSKSEREVPEFATVPRTKRNKVDENDRWGGRDSIRIPLHAEDSIEDEEREDEEREDSVERRMASHIRYDQDIDIDDAYEKENQEIHTASPFSHDYNSRWNHGSFHPGSELESENRNRQVTDLDSPGDGPHPHESFDTNTSKDIHSSESSLGIHRRGVLEEIDSDEFFLRQKGISQDNIEVGMYLSSEIREAFKYPSNALADLQRGHLDYSYDPRASNQSLPEAPTKRKAVKKPKRKKTPHVSQEQISFDQDSEVDTELPPPRPKRRSKRNKKQKDLGNLIPYQETIAVDVPDTTTEVLHDLNGDKQLMYENEEMQGKEQPEIILSDPYAVHETRYDSEEEMFKESKPAAPPRKHRSLKSLSYSEHDSILGDVDPDIEHPAEEIEIYKTEHEYIIPTPEIPPIKPKRTLSRSSSKSRGEDFQREIQETPIRPTRTRSSSRTRSRAESLTIEEPCIEQPCVQDLRDCMGYAIIDKNTKREPPLPPPRTPPRRKKLAQSNLSEQRFFTVPRPLNDEPPTRPLRNYSTLGPSRPPRRKQPINMTDEEKENIDITQYIEIDEEPNRDLISGEVIQKMRDRPLPAPPRPPRKTRTLQDITSQENIATGSQENIDEEEEKVFVDEAEVSTQTEPLPEDFLCEETNNQDFVAKEPQIEEKTQEAVTVERRLITPKTYTYEEETITHGSLVVEPINGARILPDSDFSKIEKRREHTIPVTKDYEDETSEIPEEFTRLRNPEPVQTSEKPADSTPIQPSVIERIIERPVCIQPDSNTEVEVLKAQKLQVSDLDVDRLSVNELLASRIVVSEIDSGNIQTHELSSKSGAIKLGEIELPPGLVQQLFEKLQSVAQEQQSSIPIDPKIVPETSADEVTDDSGQKKNSD